MAITLEKEEYEHKKEMLAKAKILKNKAQSVIAKVQKNDIGKATELEDMIATYRMNVVNKNPDINKFDDAAIEIAMIPIYETISNIGVV